MWDGEFNGVDFVEVPYILAMQGNCLFTTVSLYAEYRNIICRYVRILWSYKRRSANIQNLSLLHLEMSTHILTMNGETCSNLYGLYGFIWFGT